MLQQAPSSKLQPALLLSSSHHLSLDHWGEPHPFTIVVIFVVVVDQFICVVVELGVVVVLDQLWWVVVEVLGFVVVEVMGVGLNEHVSRQKLGPYELYRSWKSAFEQQVHLSAA